MSSTCWKCGSVMFAGQTQCEVCSYKNDHRDLRIAALEEALDAVLWGEALDMDMAVWGSNLSLSRWPAYLELTASIGKNARDRELLLAAVGR